MSEVAQSADPATVRSLLPNLDERVKAFVADFVRLTADVMNNRGSSLVRESGFAACAKMPSRRHVPEREEARCRG